MTLRLRSAFLLFGLVLALPAMAFYLEPRIIGGEPAAEGEVPWQVAMLSNAENTFDSQFCGGTIVSAEWVVSAAHCFVDSEGNVDSDPVFVASGVLNLTAAGEDDVVSVTEIVIHPDYDEQSTGFENDIAALKLAQPLELDGLKRHAIGWLQPDQGALEAPGTAVTVSGWGSTEREEEDWTYPDALQVVELAFIDCTQTGYSNATTANMLCATNEDYSKDSCVGDSGGPLAVQDASDRWHLAGIVSFGPPTCALDNFPGVYTRASRYDNWLQQTIGLNADGEPVEDDGGSNSPSESGSGSGGSGGGSALGSLSNPLGLLLMFALAGLGLTARRRAILQHKGDHS